ncbi:hypothetical protein DFS34DRAFT_31196 [Phlyctochytrium arcticum]|nr:hypothetical protein DFS34DRAFT_31196 [Phlyctochytrium arcticum]
MRLHQYAFNPSVYRPNPYVDVTKLNLGVYEQDVFDAPESLSESDQEASSAAAVAVAAATSMAAITVSVDTTPVRQNHPPVFLPITPEPHADARFNLRSHHTPSPMLEIKSEFSSTSLRQCIIPTPSATCTPSPSVAYLPDVQGEILRNSPFPFLSPEVSFASEDDYGSSQASSFLQDDSDDDLSGLVCPSSDYTPFEMSSPIDFQPPFSGLPTPEDETGTSPSAFNLHYTRSSMRRMSLSSVLSEPSIEPSRVLRTRKRKSSDWDDDENDENAHPQTHMSKKERDRREQCKIACVHCKKACKKCDNLRPCSRCCRMGYAASCSDAPRKERSKATNRRAPYSKRASVDSRDDDSGNEWSQSPPVFEYSGAEAYTPDPTRSSPISSDLPPSAAATVAKTPARTTTAYLATPITNTRQAPKRSPIRHFVSPLNIFAPPDTRSSTRRRRE